MTSPVVVEARRPRPRWHLEMASTATCGLAALAGWLAPSVGLGVLSLPALGVAYVTGGWDAARRTVIGLRQADIDVDLLMLLAALGAASVGHALEGAVLLFLFSLGNTLETYAFGHTRRSIEALMELRPEEAAVVDAGRERPVAVAELRPGQVVRVRPGERIPIDGDVSEGGSRVDESTLTGEPVPVLKARGDPVFAGTLNDSGSLDIRVTRRADDTALARVIRLVEEARDARAPTQSWIEEVQGRYAVGVIAAAGLAILVPWTLLGWPLSDALYRAMTLLVVASPCALVISIPATIVSAVANGARHRVLFKGGAHLDALAGVRAIGLDKTGTLTRGTPDLVGVRALRVPALATAGATGPSDEPGDERLLRLAAAVETLSEHPLASALVEAARARGLSLDAPDGFRATAAQGVEARVADRHVCVGRRSWIEARVGRPVPEDLSSWSAEHAPATPVFVAVDGDHAGALAVADPIRPGVAEALRSLRGLGISRIVMLTGDDRTTASEVGRRVGIDEVYAELLPAEKSAILDRIREETGPVAMVGDGVNDAPALAVADVGVAVGAAGTDVALETADVVVMGEDLSDLAHALSLSHRARRIVRQNLVFSVGVMATLVVLALGGWIGLTTGVLGHEGSTIVVVLNGLRLLGNGRLA